MRLQPARIGRADRSGCTFKERKHWGEDEMDRKEHMEDMCVRLHPNPMQIDKQLHLSMSMPMSVSLSVCMCAYMCICVCVREYGCMHL